MKWNYPKEETLYKGFNTKKPDKNHKGEKNHYVKLHIFKIVTIFWYHNNSSFIKYLTVLKEKKNWMENLYWKDGILITAHV